jgi:hypothetical protein
MLCGRHYTASPFNPFGVKSYFFHSTFGAIHPKARHVTVLDQYCPAGRKPIPADQKRDIPSEVQSSLLPLSFR